AQGIRRWPLFLSLAQMILKFIAPGGLAGPLPKRPWPWYTREHTVGPGRRRWLEAGQPRIACEKVDRPIRQKLAKAAECAQVARLRSRKLALHYACHTPGYERQVIGLP